VTVERAATAT
jgi:hypothetical protein